MPISLITVKNYSMSAMVYVLRFSARGGGDDIRFKNLKVKNKNTLLKYKINNNYVFNLYTAK